MWSGTAGEGLPWQKVNNIRICPLGHVQKSCRVVPFKWLNNNDEWLSEGTQVWRDLEFGRLREELKEGVRLRVYQSIFIPTLICGPERRMATKSFLCRLSLALEIKHLQGAAKSQEDLVVVVFNRAPLKSLYGEVFWAFLSGRRPQTTPDPDTFVSLGWTGINFGFPRSWWKWLWKGVSGPPCRGCYLMTWMP